MEPWLAVLDRDGIINFDHGYVHKVEDVDFMDGIFSLCKEIQDFGGFICIATNQSGLGRGLYTQKQFDELSEWIEGQFLRNGVKISRTYFCPHLPPELNKDGCSCRKPEPGMLLKAMRDHGVTAKRSLIVGDNISDVLAGTRAGFGHRVLVGDFETQSAATITVPSLKSALDAKLIERVVSDFDKSR